MGRVTSASLRNRRRFPRERWFGFSAAISLNTFFLFLSSFFFFLFLLLCFSVLYKVLLGVESRILTVIEFKMFSPQLYIDAHAISGITG